MWKTFDDWSSHDSDFNLSLTSGTSGSVFQMKATVSVSGETWKLLLYDYSRTGDPYQWTGKVQQTNGAIGFTVDPPNAPKPPGPVYPQYDDKSEVPV